MVMNPNEMHFYHPARADSCYSGEVTAIAMGRQRQNQDSRSDDQISLSAIQNNPTSHPGIAHNQNNSCFNINLGNQNQSQANLTRHTQAAHPNLQTAVGGQLNQLSVS